MTIITMTAPIAKIAIAYLLGFFVILLVSIFDSQAFIHASQTWNNGKLVWKNVALTYLLFIISTTFFIVSVKLFQDVGVFSAQIQTIIWFFGTVVLISIFNKDIFRWQRIDQIVAVLVFVGIGWLIYHTDK